jgi:hypothetical protein
MEYREPRPKNFPPPEFSYERILYFNRTDGVDDDGQDSALFEKIMQKVHNVSLPAKIKALYNVQQPLITISVYRYDYAEYYTSGDFAIRIWLDFIKSNSFKQKIIDIVIENLFMDKELSIKNTCITK